MVDAGHYAIVDSPDAFLDDTPMAVLIRQVLGAVAQFEKASPVAKLAAARQAHRPAWRTEVERQAQSCGW